MPRASKAGGVALLNDATEGDLVTSNYLFRLPVDLNGHSSPEQYLQETYNGLNFELVDNYKTKEINPDNITTFNVYTSTYDPNAQYARFGYTDLPTTNIYSGANTFSLITGTSGNLAGAKYPRACMPKTFLSIVFPPNTFETFDLESVKQYLTDNPLIFWYV